MLPQFLPEQSPIAASPFQQYCTHKTKVEKVKQIFEHFVLPNVYYTHKLQGFGFVEFDNEKDSI